MTPGQRGGIALAFVAVIGVALAGPVLNAEDDPSSARKRARNGTPEPTEEPTPTETPTEEPSPTPTETPEPEGPPTEMASAYPEECLSPQPLPDEPGAIAAISESGTLIASPSGEVLSQITGADGPVSFSPSGDFLLTGAGLLFNADGTQEGPMFGDAVLGWSWSPQADCAVAVDEGGRLVVAPVGEDPTVLFEGPVQNFAVSATRLAISTEGGLISIYNLRNSNQVGEGDFIEGGPEAKLVGWAGESLVYASGTRNKLDLRSITARPNSTKNVDLGAQVGPELAVPCSDRLIGVAPNGSLIDVDSGETFGDGSFVHGTPACSPDGTFIAVPRRARGSGDDFRIAILGSDGTFEQDVAEAQPGHEGAPEWAPSGSRLIYVKETGPTVGEIWYAAPEDSGASGVNVALDAGSYDWNVTPPSGLPPQ